LGQVLATTPGLAARGKLTQRLFALTEKAVRGIAIVFGPVMDPRAVYGIGIYQVEDEAEMRKLLELDPANGLLRYDVLPMARAVVGTLRGP